jgi:hypothetical protein
MSRPNAYFALKGDDRPGPQVRIKAADLAKYKSEDTIQIEVAAWLDAKLPHDWRWYHPPNGGFRKKSTAGRFKAMGLKPGIPDVVILRADGAPIYIELKSFGGILSPPQREFRDWCHRSGQPYFVARSRAEVELIMKEFLDRRRAA